MSEKNYALRVGLFVLMGIVLVGALMLNFSRGIGMFQPKYELNMRVRSVAGLKERSAVLLSGVQIGNVKSVELDQKNKGAIVHLTILKKYQLPSDSKFSIQQQNVLGDQFVIISPGSSDAPPLRDGDEVRGDEPFDLQEVARSTTDLLKRFERLGGTVEEAIHRVNDQVLDAQTLSNLSLTIVNFGKVSDRTLALVDGASMLVTNGGPALTLALSNLMAFSSKLEKLAIDIDEAIVTNRVELNESMKNFRDATASLKQMTAELQSGKGPAGSLLKDEELRAQISVTVSNFSVLSSNINSRGLWSILWKPKQPKDDRQRK